MVFKDEVCRWFGESEPHRRLELICGLLNMCLPLELRFLGTCVEDLGKRDAQDLRDVEAKANIPLEVNLLPKVLDERTRSKLVVFVALLNSSNHACSSALYSILLEAQNHPTVPDENYIKEILIIYTMVLHHPAFTFDQKRVIGELFKVVLRMESQLRPPAQSEVCDVGLSSLGNVENETSATQHPSQNLRDQQKAICAGEVAVCQDSSSGGSVESAEALLKDCRSVSTQYIYNSYYEPQAGALNNNTESLDVCMPNAPCNFFQVNQSLNSGLPKNKDCLPHSPPQSTSPQSSSSPSYASPPESLSPVSIPGGLDRTTEVTVVTSTIPIVTNAAIVKVSSQSSVRSPQRTPGQKCTQRIYRPGDGPLRPTKAVSSSNSNSAGRGSPTDANSPAGSWRSQGHSESGRIVGSPLGVSSAIGRPVTSPAVTQSTKRSPGLRQNIAEPTKTASAAIVGCHGTTTVTTTTASMSSRQSGGTTTSVSANQTTLNKPVTNQITEKNHSPSADFFRHENLKEYFSELGPISTEELQHMSDIELMERIPGLTKATLLKFRIILDELQSPTNTHRSNGFVSPHSPLSPLHRSSPSIPVARAGKPPLLDTPLTPQEQAIVLKPGIAETNNSHDALCDKVADSVVSAKKNDGSKILPVVASIGDTSVEYDFYSNTVKDLVGNPDDVGGITFMCPEELSAVMAQPIQSTNTPIEVPHATPLPHWRQQQPPGYCDIPMSGGKTSNTLPIIADSSVMTATKLLSNSDNTTSIVGIPPVFPVVEMAEGSPPFSNYNSSPLLPGPGHSQGYRFPIQVGFRPGPLCYPSFHPSVINPPSQPPHYTSRGGGSTTSSSRSSTGSGPIIFRQGFQEPQGSDSSPSSSQYSSPPQTPSPDNAREKKVKDCDTTDGWEGREGENLNHPCMGNPTAMVPPSGQLSQPRFIPYQPMMMGFHQGMLRYPNPNMGMIPPMGLDKTGQEMLPDVGGDLAPESIPPGGASVQYAPPYPMMQMMHPPPHNVNGYHSLPPGNFSYTNPPECIYNGINYYNQTGGPPMHTPIPLGGYPPSPYMMPGPPSLPKKPVTCYNCGQVGHLGMDCHEASIEEMTKRGKQT